MRSVERAREPRADGAAVEAEVQDRREDEAEREEREAEQLVLVLERGRFSSASSRARGRVAEAAASSCEQPCSRDSTSRLPRSCGRAQLRRRGLEPRRRRARRRRGSRSRASRPSPPRGPCRPGRSARSRCAARPGCRARRVDAHPRRVLQRHADDLLVRPLLVGHVEDADDPAADAATGKRRLADEDERVERIAVAAHRALDEPVVRRIRHRGEQPPVEDDRRRAPSSSSYLFREPDGTSTKTTTCSATR